MSSTLVKKTIKKHRTTDDSIVPKNKIQKNTTG